MNIGVCLKVGSSSVFLANKLCLFCPMLPRQFQLGHLLSRFYGEFFGSCHQQNSVCHVSFLVPCPLAFRLCRFFPMVPRQHQHQSLSQGWVEFSVSGEQAFSFLPYGAAPVPAWSPSQQLLTVISNQFAGFLFGSTVWFLQPLSFFAQSSSLTPLTFSAVHGGKSAVNGERNCFKFRALN